MFANQVNRMLVPSAVCKDDYSRKVFAFAMSKNRPDKYSGCCFLSENTAAILFACWRARCCHIVEKQNCDSDEHRFF